MQKIDWMVEQAQAEGYNLNYDDIAFLLLVEGEGSVDSYTESELAYVQELSDEWDAD